jgi:ABC-type molybdate transport system ATPase subunit
MSIPLPFRKRSARDQARQDWIDERRHEARIVVAYVAHHSDHLLRLACRVLIQHGETPAEREDARIVLVVLVVLDAKHPGRGGNHRSDPEVRR